MSIKQPLTKPRAERVGDSLERLYLMSKVLLIESVNELDTDFKMPTINNFARRIQADCQAINTHLDRSGYFETAHNEATEEFAGEVWRVFALLARLDVALVRGFADNLEKEFKAIGI